MATKTPLIFGDNSHPVAIYYGKPAVKDDDFFLTNTDIDPDALKVTINKSIPAAEPPRTVILTVTEDTAEDTVGGIVIVGEDDGGRTIVERFVPTAAGADETWDNAEVYTTTQAFRRVNSVELTGYTVSSGTDNDAYKVGFGDAIGLGVKLGDKEDVIWATLDNAVQAHKDKVTAHATDVNKNLIDLSAGTLSTSKPVKVILVPKP